MPHAYILLFLYSNSKHFTLSEIDENISVEILDKNVDPKGYIAIKNFMTYRPCNSYNRDAPCMFKDNYIKHFSKEFYNQTIMVKDGFPIYIKGGSLGYVLIGRVFSLIICMLFHIMDI